MMGQNHFASTPVALYGVVLLLSGVAYKILQETIIALQGEGSLLKRAVGGDWKGLVPLILYGIAIPMAFWFPAISLACYIAVSLLWLVPDRRIERVLLRGE